MKTKKAKQNKKKDDTIEVVPVPQQQQHQQIVQTTSADHVPEMSSTNILHHESATESNISDAAVVQIEYIDKFADNSVHLIEDTHLLVQLSKVCRCCLSETNPISLRQVFDNDNCIAEMIMALATVRVCKLINIYIICLDLYMKMKPNYFVFQKGISRRSATKSNLFAMHC